MKVAIAEGRHDRSDYQMSASGNDEYENYDSNNGYEINETPISNENIAKNCLKSEEKGNLDVRNFVTSKDEKEVIPKENDDKISTKGMTTGNDLEFGSSSKKRAEVDYGMLTVEPTASTHFTLCHHILQPINITFFSLYITFLPFYRFLL